MESYEYKWKEEVENKKKKTNYIIQTHLQRTTFDHDDH